MDRPVSRRNVLVGGSGLAAGLLLARADRITLAQDQSLVLYSGRSEGLIAPLVEQFSASSGISVDARYGSTAEMAATILEEGTNSPADVFLAQDAGALGALEKEGMLAILESATLELVDERFRSDTGVWVGASGRARVAVFNTEMLNQDAMPTSVHAFTEAEWKGKVGWAPANASFQSFVTALRVLEGEAAAQQWLEAMIANEAVTYENNDSIVLSVAAGEIPTGLVNHYYKWEIEKEEGALPIQNHYFDANDPGSLINVAGSGILTTAANMESAATFVEYLLGEEAQVYFATETFEYPLIEGIEGPEGVPTLAEVGSPDIDLSDLADLEGTLALLTEVGLL